MCVIGNVWVWVLRNEFLGFGISDLRVRVLVEVGFGSAKSVSFFQEIGLFKLLYHFFLFGCRLQTKS